MGDILWMISVPVRTGLCCRGSGSPVFRDHCRDPISFSLTQTERQMMKMSLLYPKWWSSLFPRPPRCSTVSPSGAPIGFYAVNKTERSKTNNTKQQHFSSEVFHVFSQCNDKHQFVLLGFYVIKSKQNDVFNLFYTNQKSIACEDHFVSAIFTLIKVTWTLLISLLDQ